MFCSLSDILGVGKDLEEVDIAIVGIGAATARVARVRTLPTFGILTWDPPPKFCSKVLIHYTMDPTIFSTPAAPLNLWDVQHVL